MTSCFAACAKSKLAFFARSAKWHRGCARRLAPRAQPSHFEGWLRPGREFKQGASPTNISSDSYYMSSSGQIDYRCSRVDTEQVRRRGRENPVGKIVVDMQCRIGSSCPRVEREIEGWWDIVGDHVSDDTLPAHERRVRVPERTFPGVAHLDITNFGAWLQANRKTPGDILRVQTLDAYEVESDGGDFAAYVRGAPGPTSPERKPFFDELRQERAKGMVWRDLTVVNGPLSDYQRYGFDWVCPDAVAAGQDIRVLDIADHPAAAVLLALGDFWVIEGEQVVLVRYDAEGRHVGEVQVTAQGVHGYIAAAEMAWCLGTPFTDWWEAHPQYPRVPRTV